MSPRHLRLYIAASATALTLLAVVAGTSSSPNTLLVGIILVLPILPLWTGAPAIALAGTERRS